MSTSVKRKRSGPQGLRKPTSARQLKAFFGHHSLDLAAPCSAPEEQDEPTPGKTPCCWVVESLEVWNAILHSAGVELREMVPGELTLQTFIDRYPGVTDYRAVCVCLVARLINDHRCVRSVSLGYAGELFGPKSRTLSRLRPNAGIRRILLSGSGIYEAESNALVRALLRGGPRVLSLQQVVLGTLEISALSEAVTTSSRLTELNLSDNGMKSGDTIALIEALQTSAITNLKIDYNAIGVKGAQRLAKLLEGNKKLVKLSLFKTKLGDGGAMAIAAALAANDVLQYLMLGGNVIGATGAGALSLSLWKNSSLLTLDLRENHLETRGAIFLADALLGNQTLQELYLCSNSIGDEGVVAIAEALAMNKVLRVLSVHANCFGSHGFVALARVVASDGTLVKLNATCRPSRNDVPPFEELSEALARNRRLEGVELSLLDSAAVLGLSAALRLNSTLRHLSLRACVSDLSPLFNSLAVNKTVELLELHVVLSAHCAEALSRLLRETTTIRSLVIPPRMSKTSLLHLVQALSTNTSVWWFHASSITMRGPLCEAIADMLSVNRTLNSFILDKVSTDEACFGQLADALESNTSMLQLGIAYPASSDGGYRIGSLVRRNWSLMNSAIQFALRNVVDKRAARAFQVFRRSGFFLGELEKVARASSECLSARELIRAADCRILHNFLTIAGIVKQRLLCSKPRGKKHTTTFDQLNAYCLYKIFSYLKVSDIK